jgi:hypothetical protein
VTRYKSPIAAERALNADRVGSNSSRRRRSSAALTDRRPSRRFDADVRRRYPRPEEIPADKAARIRWLLVLADHYRMTAEDVLAELIALDVIRLAFAQRED